MPLILVIFAIGFGLPALSLTVVSSQSAAVYRVAALVLSYSAYVCEVYRAGLNSVHQSQVAAARSLGLPQWTSLRYVILPQAVRIEDLHKSFGANQVLTGINLSLATHEVICLIGASGSGKSTLLRCINLLEPIGAGRIWLAGQEITSATVDPNLVRRHVGTVFQSFNLFPHMTVLRNVTLAPVKVLRMPRAAAEREARELLHRFGLQGKETDFPDRLSGGQQQRVAIVRALAMRPQIMLLDQITSALDPELVAEVPDVSRELAAGGMTMLIATHEMGFARDIANRVCFLEDGQIVEDAPPAELFSQPKDERTQRFPRRIVDADRL